MYTTTYHHPITKTNTNSYLWKEEDTLLFNELIISWNIKLLANQDYRIEAQLKIEGQWTPWFTYAYWGVSQRLAYHKKMDAFSVLIDQDQIKILNDKLADGFQIKISSEKQITHAAYLHACVSQPKHLKLNRNALPQSVYHPVPFHSQITLPHKRCMTMCSPTSITAVIQFLTQNKSLNPLDVAEQVRDHTFDIYGNWVFNTAYAYTLLPSPFYSWVERISSFKRVQDLLLKGYPLVISIKTTKDAADGHLIGLVGYDSASQEVLCMDPAKKDYPTKFSLEKLVECWGYRGYIAYIFSPIN